MKKFYASALALTACLGMAAQALPNEGFEGEWVASCPWNTVSGTSYSMTDALQKMEGAQETDVKVDPILQPKGWIISNVLGVVQTISEGDGGGFGALGSTVVGYKAEGCNSATAVKLVNSPNPFMATQIVPAYISFGTSWATNALKMFQPVDKDGGVFGGLEFTGRPDLLTFDYKLEAPEDGKGQKATVLVYAWKGSWSQADVPGNNAMVGAPITTTMVDRDRNILGMETSQGGEVTHSDDAELIAKSLEYIEEPTSDWKTFELPVEYLTKSAPEKINVLFAANDYFDSEKIVNGNSLTVDNVNFVYYSRLKSLKIDDVEVPGFDSNKFKYDMTDTELPALESFTAEHMANLPSAKVEIALDNAAATATIKVSNLNEGGLDVDGKATHEYVIVFKAPALEVLPTYGGQYEGEVSVSLPGADPVVVPGVVIVTPDEANAAKCTFELPDFSLGEGAGLGDIVVPDVDVTATEDGGFTFVGAVKGLKLNMSGSEIVANVNLNGTIDKDGVAVMNIPVIWLMDPVNDPEGTTLAMPIDVKFNGKFKSTAINAVETATEGRVEYFNLNGIRVSAANLTPGIYIKRQGGKAQKVYVK